MLVAGLVHAPHYRQGPQAAKLGEGLVNINGTLHLEHAAADLITHEDAESQQHEHWNGGKDHNDGALAKEEKSNERLILL